MTEKTRTKLNEGDQIIIKLSQGHWIAHVQHSGGGISGRIVPFKRFDDALAALKEDYLL